MERLLRKQELMLIAMELDATDLFNFCKSDTFVEKKVCTDPILWRLKLKKEYPYLEISKVSSKNLRSLYEYLTSRAEIAPISKKFGYDVLNKYEKKYSMYGKFLTDQNGKYINGSIADLRLGFPEYSPEYLSEVFKPGMDIAFKISEDKMSEFVKNFNFDTKTSYITGNFGEVYPAAFKNKRIYTDAVTAEALEYLEKHPQEEQAYFDRGRIELN
jgi:hypothetical protein